jgi:hypothetical protein
MLFQVVKTGMISRLKLMQVNQNTLYFSLQWFTDFSIHVPNNRILYHVGDSLVKLKSVPMNLFLSLERDV